VARFRPTQGAMTRAEASTPRPRRPNFRATDAGRAARAAGIKRKGMKRMSSARTRASAPQATPRRTALTQVGRRRSRTMARRMRAMISMAGVSDIRMPLGSHMLG
jgi:hypothetical protein